MKFHHTGVACRDIEQSINMLKRTHVIKKISSIIYDPEQDATVCLVEFEDVSSIELISGPAVKNLVKDVESQIYHICYEVDDIDEVIENYLSSGGVIVSLPRPALLFAKRKVVFIQTQFGLLEFLEAEKGYIEKNNKKYTNLVIASTYTADLFLDGLKRINKIFEDEFAASIVPYNQVLQQLYDPYSQFMANNSGCNIILTRFSDWCKNDISQTAEKISEELSEAVRIYIHNSSSLLIIALCPDKHPHQEKFEQLLKKQLEHVSQVFILDSTFIKKNDFLDIDFDDEANYQGHIPYKVEGFQAIAKSIIRCISGLRRQPYKVIAVDCDNTLWSGISGEVGVGELEILEKHAELQNFLIDQVQQGMLLALVSKNNEADVIRVFETHPKMLIKLEHVVIKKINWQAKSNNIEEMANDLNLGIDSFIFIDDNPLEIAEVQAALPQVLSLLLPGNVADLNKIWAFDHFKITEDDKRRTEFYHAEKSRNTMAAESVNFQEFLDKLDINIEFINATLGNISRLSQLTSRVNQFNFTALIWSEAEITKLIRQGTQVLGILVKDRFGDYGLSGLIAYDKQHDTLHVKNFLLSCRVLGKGIEHKIIVSLSERALDERFEHLVLEFVKTAKNRPALDFLESLPLLRACENNHYFLLKDLCNLKYNPKKAYTIDKVRKAKTISDSDRIRLNSILLKAAGLEREMIAASMPMDFLKNKMLIKEQLKIIWQNLLDTKKTISDYDSFFNLGGNSLRAIQLISRIYYEFGVRFTLQDIYANPTIDELFICINRNHKEKIGRLSVFNLEYDVYYPLLLSQKSLWFTNYLSPNNYAYNMPLALEIKGRLNLEALKFSFQSIIKKHPVFRSIFIEIDGEPFQKVLPHIELDFSIIEEGDLAADNINRLADNEEIKPFSLDKAPLLRVVVIKVCQDITILLVTTHHIIFDGWSYDIFFEDLSYYYQIYDVDKAASLLIKEDSSFYSYIEQQNNFSKTDEYNKQIIFWKNYLSGTKLLSLPTIQKLEKKELDYAGEFFQFDIDDVLVAKLQRALRLNRNISLYAITLSAFVLQMYSLTNISDFVVATVSAGRSEQEYEKTIGLFIKTLLFRAKIDLSQRVQDFINLNHKSFLEILSNQDLAYEKILRSLADDQKKTFMGDKVEAVFVLQNTKNSDLILPGLDIKKYKRGYNIARFKYILELEEKDGQILAGIYYRSNLYEKKTIEKMAGQYMEFLSKVLQHQDGHIEQILV